MPKATDSLINYLYTLAGTWRDDLHDDAELLARYADKGDEVAFKSIVWRHGPMVWQTCKRVLGNGPDAEDAFQVTFLTLTRKAGRLRRQPLAGWLHRVARQTALDFNTNIQLRRKREHQPCTSDRLEEKDSGRTELCLAIDEEINSLPEKLRIPLVLHYLEEKTQEEVARIVGCSRNTAQNRLEKGKEALRDRLARRGLPFNAGAIVSLLRDKTSALAMPADVIASTVRSAMAFRAESLSNVTMSAAEKLIRSFSLKGAIWKNWWLGLMCVCSLSIGGGCLIIWKLVLGDSSNEVVPTAPKSALQRIVVESRNKRVDLYGDPLPEGAVARIGTVRFRGPGTTILGSDEQRLLFGTALTQDGKKLALACEDGVHFWDMATGLALPKALLKLKFGP